MRLSDDELAIVARLVRVLRIRTYWLGAYIEWLLEAEAETTDAVDVAEAIKVLEDIKGLNSWANWFESARSKRRSILRYYGINSASTSELKALPGIGDAYSAAIIKNRPYANKRQLLSRKVIPQATYDKISDQIIAKQNKSMRRGSPS